MAVKSILEVIMKKVVVVFAVILLFIGWAGSGLLTWRDFRDAGQIREAESMLKGIGMDSNESKDLLNKFQLPVTSRALQIGGMLALVAVVLGLAVLVLLFLKKDGLLTPAALIFLAAVVAMILLNPDYKTGIAGPASARALAMVVGIPALLGGILALLAARMRRTV